MKKKLIGFQIESNDGRHNIPQGLASYEIFGSKRKAIRYIKENCSDPENWIILPIAEGDIEEPSWHN